MANPYTSVNVNNYNANPPTDDGTKTTNNQISWAKIKTKLSDPINTAFATLNSNVGSAFAKQLGTAGAAGVSTDTTVVVTDQGRTFEFTAADLTLTLPDAAATGTFIIGVRNGSSGKLTVAAAEATPTQLVNGAASIILAPGDGGLLIGDGSNFKYIGTTAGQTFAAGTKTLFFQTAAPLGWTKDTTLDDAGIRLTSGTVTDGGTVAFSDVFKEVTLLKANLPNYDLDLSNLTIEITNGTQVVRGGGNAGNGAGGGGTIQQVWANGNAYTLSATPGGKIQLGGSATPLDFRLKYAAAIRAAKN